MKTLILLIFLLVAASACNNRNSTEDTSNQDTMDFIPGYGGGHEPGKGEENSPSYPRETYQQEPEVDTLRGIHGVNVDTTGTSQ